MQQFKIYQKEVANMALYTEKEQLILNQYKNGPYYKVVTNLTEKEHLHFVNKLIDDKEFYCIIFLTCIYTSYNQKFLIDFYKLQRL